MRIMVTGASGFVARPLLAALLRASFVVRAVTRRHVSLPDGVESTINIATALPWPAGTDCPRGDPAVADFLFGLTAQDAG